MALLIKVLIGLWRKFVSLRGVNATSTSYVSPSDTQSSTQWDASNSAERETLRQQWQQASLKRQQQLQAGRIKEQTRLTAIAESRDWSIYERKQNAGTGNADSFYRSQRWRNLRYQAFLRYGRVCALCKRTPEVNGVVLHVDHILPRSKYPGQQWNLENLQILCEDCNIGKGATDKTKWR
jgi:5-methylcytosine-specific restriction endonuclease McrA